VNGDSPHVGFPKLGVKSAALNDYNRTIELDRALAVNYYRCGNLYYSTKDYTRAIADHSQAIELKPHFALAYSSRSYADRELSGK